MADIDYANLGIALVSVISAIFAFLFERRKELLKEIEQLNSKRTAFIEKYKEIMADENFSETIAGKEYDSLISTLNEQFSRDYHALWLIQISFSIICLASIITILWILGNLDTSDNPLKDLVPFIAIDTVAFTIFLNLALFWTIRKSENK